MKKKFLAWLLCTAMAAVMLPVTAWADSADPVMTLTTSRAIGSNIMLSLQAANAEDLAGVWVDLNGNAVKDTGEDNVGLYKSYTISSQTITIYGKVTLLDCVLADTTTALDVSENPYLESLTCRSGSLTALDVTQNTALTKLDVYHNSLTTLDVSQNTALTELNVSDNQITALDVSGNTALQTLNCSNNAVAALDLSANTLLASLLCANCGLTGLNVSAQTALVGLNCRNNAISSLDLSANTALSNLECTNNALTSLTLPQSTALKRVQCEKNQLTSLDVTHNTAMTVLNCAINKLTALDISQNTALMQVKLYCNRIKGAAMTNIVSALAATTENYKLYVIDTAASPADGNVAPESDVAVATGRGWKVMDWNDGYEQAYAGGTDPAATTFVLSNEEGGLIDRLIAGGYGDGSLYDALVALEPASGGIISQIFLDTLSNCPAGSEIFTAKLSDFTGINNPVGINTDGTLIIVPIFGRDYYGQTGYSNYPTTLVPGDTNFVEAGSPGYYIDAGSSGSINYHAFAIAWMPSDTLTVAGTATDDTAILQIDNKTPSARDKAWEINVTSGTVATGVSASDVTLTGLPAGLSYTAAKGTGNTIVITLTGAATTARTADATLTATIKGSAVTEEGAQDSAGISLKLWYIGAGTTLVISNELGTEDEGGLIDALIAASYGDDTMYEVLELSQPDFSSVITERFVKTLDSTPAGSEVFTVALSNFAGVNGPVGINADGTLTITAIYGRDYDGDTGYTTASSTYTGVGVVRLTTADSEDDYIPAGSSSVGGVTTNYYALAIAWMSTGGGGDDDPVAPTVVTNDPSGITASGATLNGNVTASGSASVTERGFVYGSSANPAVGGTGVTKVTVGSGTGIFNTAISGLAASTPYHVRAYATSSAGTAYGEDRAFTTKTGGGGDSTTQTYNADVKQSGVTTDTLPVMVSDSIGTASLNGAKAENLLRAGNASVSMPNISGVSAYRLEFPASALSVDQRGGALTLTTGFGSVTFSDNMLSSLTGTEEKTAGITVARGDAFGLSEAEKAAVGNRPIVQLTLTLDGTQTAWNNHAAPIAVTIPYTPTAEELKTPESLIIWYLDGSGKLVCLPNGHFDAATGTVTFTTTHFSKYAVGYNPVSFKDVADAAWYKKAVAFIGARGITAGTGNGNYGPDAKLTRGEFIVLLMRAYSIAPDTTPTDNFADAGNTYYTNYLAATKRLGISAGVGNDMFAPGREITRQEVFTLLYNALNVIGQLPQGNSGKTLADFSDTGNIASWAKEALTLLVKTGTVSGSDGKLSPTDTTTRAEMAQMLYNLLMK
ncbi:MAG: S-layer homology domain-containing protein [Firmicutes bacterium]|nr:S-layer homology domain-containing protein [Candidatus Fermentithermobacillaceae bacterium]